jgi:ribosomal subunit interface protein
MDLKITARNFDMSDAIQDLARALSARLDRFSALIVDAHLILEKEKPLDLVELTVAIKKGFLRADIRTNDMYQGMHEVFAKVEKQLKKRREILRERKRTAQKGKREV